jgi:hypothetical protein
MWFDRAQRFLNDSIFRVSAARVLVFVFWNPEKQNRLESQILRTARLIGQLP